MIELSVEVINQFEVIALDDIFNEFLILFILPLVCCIDKVNVVFPVILRIELEEGILGFIFFTFLDKGKVLSCVLFMVVGLECNAGLRMQVDQPMDSEGIFGQPGVLIFSIVHFLEGELHGFGLS